MSFNSRSLWMGKDLVNVDDNSETVYDNSSGIESKRPRLCFMDGTVTDLFPNKKQAVEVPNCSSFAELLNSNISPWGNVSRFQSVAGQFTERLFCQGARTNNFDDRNLPSIDLRNTNIETKVHENPFLSDTPFGLSKSHPPEDARLGLNYGGIRKVKVSQVKDVETFLPISIRHAYSVEDDSSLSTALAYSKADDSAITMGLSFNKGNGNMISLSNTFDSLDNNFISIGQQFNGSNNCDMSMGLPYGGNTGATSFDRSVSKDNNNITSVTENFHGGDQENIPVGTFEENGISLSVVQATRKDDNNVASLDRTFNKDVCSTTLMSNSYGKVDDYAMSTGKVDSSHLLVGHSFSNGESNIISFGGLNDDDDVNNSGRLLCSYALLMGQPSIQRSEELSEKGLIESNFYALLNAAPITASGETVPSKKEEQKTTKKAPSNNFPSNVRSLLSTGMLDGIPVKYMAWSREKELHGIIKGSAYLCGCQSCNFSRAINAYEFERHAGCKTKHPNNHIYFENGKTVYGIVQELRNTPQNLLFEVIQTITGSPINQKSFRLWKESFLAATRELQRIYGKEGKVQA